MKAYKVCALQTPDYKLKTLVLAVNYHFKAFGVYDKLTPQSKVLLKPNLLMKRAPQTATVTHHLLVEAVIRCLQHHGIRNIMIADSPGGPYNEAMLSGIYKTSGMTETAERTGVMLNTDCGYTEVPADGEKVRSFELIDPVVWADYIIDMPKLKTHAMTGMSCAVKNLFGTVPGLKKPEFHYRFPDKNDFTDLLIDLCETVKPDFVLVDAVESMEGNGPSGGEVRYTGMTFASDSPYALDLVAADYLGIPAKNIPTIGHAIRRGLSPETLDEIKVIGSGYERVDGFKQAQTKSVTFKNYLPKCLQGVYEKKIQPLLTSRPVIVKKGCIGCGKCAQSCPAHTIRIVDHKAVIDYSNCIRCYCCHEMCPQKTIRLSRLIFYR